MDGLVSKEESLPPGFRFHPTDEELITYYLTNKISDSSFTGKAITDVDLNKSEPWDLPAKAKMGEKEWYFFSLRDRKYPTGIRTNRATHAGYWKTTGKDKEIFDSATSNMVGMKKTLVFYKGRAPRGEKTNWVMHEYRLHPKTSFRTSKDEWVVCRVFQKTNSLKKYQPPVHQQHRTNPYSFETGHSSLLPPMMQMDHFSGGRNYINNADLAEISRVLRGPQNMNIPMQTQPSYPGCFTISGLNLNLGAPTTQQGFRPVPPQNHQMMNAHSMTTADGSSSVLTNNGHVVGGNSAAFSMDMNTTMGNNHRFQNMDPYAVDLENYWPSC
ncbi:hypothetical protein C5167_015852 [Papaver somniferum]|uniref:NAC domain-containing protein n=1 Tax=Papaver somniferum TaxID=3469 RepID=A0A4Y7J788_PAPSO|nr:NAC domain-containing protein 92-like [Papaver somniferum]RZC56994.1 hypothetical protein C5167_015852 [Papaver somniferum]